MVLYNLLYAGCRVLDTCEVQLYRQMGGLRDDLSVHERALDVLIELMKKEQLDDSVPLHGLEKGISHFEVWNIPYIGPNEQALTYICQNGLNFLPISTDSVALRSSVKVF